VISKIELKAASAYAPKLTSQDTGRPTKCLLLAQSGHPRCLLFVRFGGKADIRYEPNNRDLSWPADDDVAKLVAWRRGHRRPHDGVLISPFTVNDTTEQLKKLFTRAKTWGVRLDHDPKRRDHWLKEPPERVRELVGDEGERLEAETRDDYLPFFRFAQTRLRECLLKWSEVDWDARQIRKIGKGGRMVTRTITSEIREILWPLRGHHSEYVFTFVAQRDYEGCTKGERYPLTYNGVKSHWRYRRKCVA
jgi:integrase